MLEAPVKKVTVKKVEPPVTFTYKPGDDSYMRVVAIKDEKGTFIANITQAPGHCCAASILGSLSAYGFWSKKATVNAFVEEMKKHWREEKCFTESASYNRISLFNISGFYVYLSSETRTYDMGLREHPDIKLVHSFLNKRCAGGDSSYQGNQIDLYYMEF